MTKEGSIEKLEISVTSLRDQFPEETVLEVSIQDNQLLVTVQSPAEHLLLNKKQALILSDRIKDIAARIA